MAEEKLVIEVEINGDDAAARLNEIKQEISRVKKEQKEYTDAIRKGVDVTKEQAKTFAENTRYLGELSAAEKDYTQIVIAASDKQSQYTDSLNGMSMQLAELKKQYRSLSEGLREGSAGEALLSQIHQLDEKLKSADASMGEFHRNVGNYQGSLEDFTKTIFGVDERFEKLSSLFSGAFSSGLKAGISNLAAFGKALLASPVGAIMIALTALVKLFNVLKDRLKENTKVQGQFKSVMQALEPVISLITKVLDSLLGVAGKVAEGFGNVIRGITGVKESSSELEKTIASANTEIIAEKVAFLELSRQLDKTVKGSNEYNQILAQINSKYGDYLKNLGINADELYRNKTNQNALNVELERFIKLKNLELLLDIQSETLKKQVSNSLDYLHKKFSTVIKNDPEELAKVMAKVQKALLDGKKVEIGDIFPDWKQMDFEQRNHRTNLTKTLNDTINDLNIYKDEYNKTLEEISKLEVSTVESDPKPAKPIKKTIKKTGPKIDTGLFEDDEFEDIEVEIEVKVLPDKTGFEDDLAKQIQDKTEALSGALNSILKGDLSSFETFVKTFERLGDSESAETLKRIQEIFNDPSGIGSNVEELTKYLKVLNLTEDEIDVLTDKYRELKKASDMSNLIKSGEAVEAAFAEMSSAATELVNAVNLSKESILESYSKMTEAEVATAKFEQTLGLVQATISGTVAIAKGIEKVTSSSVTWIDMLAGIATVVATITALVTQTVLTIKKLSVPAAPSFEEGGIVPGASYTGDKVRANLNSGEMVLTQKDQLRLLQLIRSPQTDISSASLTVEAFKRAIEEMPQPVLIYKEFKQFQDSKKRRDNIIQYK